MEGIPDRVVGVPSRSVYKARSRQARRTSRLAQAKREPRARDRDVRGAVGVGSTRKKTPRANPRPPTEADPAL